jgi:acid phosphatase
MFPGRKLHLFTVLVLLLLSAIGSFAAVPQVRHVFIVVEENHSYSSVIGSSSMPYLNALARRYGLATAYYADTHPSIGNYFMLTTGHVITNNDAYSGTVTTDNIVRHLLTAGKTWKAYAESLPYVGYIGGDSFPYIKHHNPFAYFSDVRDSSNERDRLVPFSHFASDLANGNLPSFSFIVPNALHDAHTGSLSAADYWLKSHIAPLIASAAFQQSLLVILFDESYDSDTAHGGGHVAAIVVGPAVKPGTRNGSFFQHQNVLKTFCSALGLGSCPGAAGSASSMVGFF